MCDWYMWFRKPNVYYTICIYIYVYIYLYYIYRGDCYERLNIRIFTATVLSAYIYIYTPSHTLPVVTFIFVEGWFPRPRVSSHPLALGDHTGHHAAVAVHIGTVPELLQRLRPGVMGGQSGSTASRNGCHEITGS